MFLFSVLWPACRLYPLPAIKKPFLQITDECLIPKGRLTKNRGERISKSPLDHRPADMTSSPRSVPEAYHLIQQSGPDPSCRHDRRHWTAGIPKQAALTIPAHTGFRSMYLTAAIKCFSSSTLEPNLACHKWPFQPFRKLIRLVYLAWASEKHRANESVSEGMAIK